METKNPEGISLPVRWWSHHGHYYGFLRGCWSQYWIVIIIIIIDYEHWLLTSLHVHLRRYGDVFMWINGEELAIRLFELEAIPFHFFDFLIWKSTLCVHLARRYIMYVWCVPHTQCCCVCCVRVFDVCVMCDGVHVCTHSWCKLHLCYCYVLRVTVVLVHTQT